MRVRSRVWMMLVILIVAVSAGAAIAATAEHEGGGGAWDVSKLTWRVINTLALIGLLVYFMRKPLVNFFKERTTAVELELAEARAARDEAELTIKEYEKKIAGMDKELNKIRAELRKATEMESDKVVANAERMAKGMIDAARVAAEQEVRKARAALQGEASRMAVEMAEGLIREKISEADQKKIFEDYLGRVEGMK